MATGRITFALKAGPLQAADLQVMRVEGQEGLSEPFQVTVDFLRRDGAPVDLEAVIGKEAELTLRRPSGEERVVHGEAHGVELVGVAAGWPRYRVTIRPRLSRLGQAARSRVFQDLSVPDIVAKVLDEHGVKHRSALAGKPAARTFTVQYRETDLAFVSRLLEDEGIWYRFEHAAGKHELVLADSKSGQASLGGTVSARDRTGQGDDAEHVFAVTRSHRSVVGQVTLRDFDFERPALDLTARKDEAGAPEVYEWPGGYLDPGPGAARAGRRLEELRHGTATLEGEGTCLGLVPGTAFELEGQGKQLTVRVVHHGEQELAPGGAAVVVAARYQNAFEAIEASRPYRPRRSTPAPRIVGVQTATVVGASGEEAHVDAHGRIKVLFHWDREGARDDSSSCWIRAAQAWAGAGMGASFVPRVGQEVVVRFLDGDPDRPLVSGAVYNGQNPTPVTLPGDKTRSTLRTDSSLGGGGSNELRLEDASQEEEIYHHAQRDQNTVVEADTTRSVLGDEGLRVDKDRTKTVLGAQSLRVVGEDASEVGGNQTLTVLGARSVGVVTNHAEQVQGVQGVTVAANRSVRVGAASADFVGLAAALSVGGAYLVNVGGVHNQAVGGLKSTQVAGAALEVVLGMREETVGKDSHARTQGEETLEVEGGLVVGVGQDLTETVDGKLELSLPEAMVLLAKDGTLQADTLTILVNGKKALVMEQSGAVTLSGANVTIEEG